MIGIPDGFTESSWGTTTAILRADWVERLAPLLAAGGMLLGEDAGERGTAPRVLLPGAPALRVRRYHRGGLVGGFLGDLCFSSSRSLRELIALLRARRRGVPVPDPVASVCCGGPMLYRHELATIEVPDARPLREALTAGDARERRLWLSRAAQAVARLHAAEIDHTDLHVGNLLAVGAEVLLLDLDRCELGVTPGRRMDNLARLYRSVAKSGVLSRALSRTDRLRFVRAYEHAWKPVDVRRLGRACERTVWWHSWVWKRVVQGFEF